MLYVGNLYRLYLGKLYRLLVRFNKYLLFRSKYLYLGTCKVLKLPKVSTQEVIEDLTDIQIYDGKGNISDEMFEKQMDLAVNVVTIGKKVVDLRQLPKGYIILRQGATDDTVIYQKVEHRHNAIPQKRKSLPSRQVEPDYQSELETEFADSMAGHANEQ